jgi:hypothetical protein
MTKLGDDEDKILWVIREICSDHQILRPLSFALSIQPPLLPHLSLSSRLH